MLEDAQPTQLFLDDAVAAPARIGEPRSVIAAPSVAARRRTQATRSSRLDDPGRSGLPSEYDASVIYWPSGGTGNRPPGARSPRAWRGHVRPCERSDG